MIAIGFRERKVQWIQVRSPKILFALFQFRSE